MSERAYQERIYARGLREVAENISDRDWRNTVYHIAWLILIEEEKGDNSE